jgi:hypothetical protein
MQRRAPLFAPLQNKPEGDKFENAGHGASLVNEGNFELLAVRGNRMLSPSPLAHCESGADLLFIVVPFVDEKPNPFPLARAFSTTLMDPTSGTL